jgi:hypothetical protein
MLSVSLSLKLITLSSFHCTKIQVPWDLGGDKDNDRKRREGEGKEERVAVETESGETEI